MAEKKIAADEQTAEVKKKKKKAAEGETAEVKKKKKKAPEGAASDVKKKKADGSKKKKSSGKGKKKQPALPDNVLPQNIVAMGSHVEENKNIYIAQSVYKQIHKFTKNKTTNESGGVLIGNVIEELGKSNIMIRGFVEAKYSESTPTTLTFTHETWEYIHGEVDKKFPGQKIVGWIHTHPDFGIFLSEYDKFIHENFFSEENQIAYVVDPIQNIEGFYFWINGKIEKCKGFYIFDNVGVDIEVGVEVEEEEEEAGWKKYFSVQNIAIAVLALLVVFLSFASLSQAAEINKLKQEQKNLVTSISNYLTSFMMTDQDLDARIGDLEGIVGELTQPSEPAATDPAATDPTGTENSEPTEPKTTEPAATEPKATEPKTTEAAVTE